MNKKLAALSVIGMIVSYALISGCGDSSSLKKEDENAVWAIFNGFELRKKDVKSYSLLRREMFRIMKPDADQLSLAKVERSTTAACLPFFIQNSIITAESSAYQKGHGSFSDSDRKAVRSWLIKEYSKKNAGEGSDFYTIRKTLASKGLADEFDKQINQEIDSELYLRIACSNRYRIAEYVITNVYNEWVINNYISAVTNRSIMALSTNVVKRIKAGDDFQELADRYTMMPEENAGGDMGFCTAADFPGEEEVWDAVKELDVGQVTDIIDAGDSWQILKVLERDDSNQKDPRLHLARIYFRRAWEIPRPSRADVVKALEEDRRQRLLKEILESRLPGSKIEFPYGNRVFSDLTPAKPYLDIIEGLATNLVNQTSGMF